jgi:hypothetical protein
MLTGLPMSVRAEAGFWTRKTYWDVDERTVVDEECDHCPHCLKKLVKSNEKPTNCSRGVF